MNQEKDFIGLLACYVKASNDIKDDFLFDSETFSSQI